MKIFDHSNRQSLREYPDVTPLRQTFVYQSVLTLSVNFNLDQANEERDYRFELDHGTKNLN